MTRPSVSSQIAAASFLALFGCFAPTASAEVVRAVEYYHKAFEHYFVTASPADIAALDSGVFPGWWRTGQRYRVDDAPAPDLVPVCRFFTSAYAGKASHFFTASAAECEYVKTMPDWTYEGVAFYARVPDAQGNCAAGTATIYRLYNNGLGGAPNHAYTADPAKLNTLVGAGWVPEGVAYCTPLASGDPVAQTQVLAGSMWDLPDFLDGDPLRFRTQFSLTTNIDHRFDRYFAFYGLLPPPAAITHSVPVVNSAWTGVAAWDALSGAYVVMGSSGFEGGSYVGEAWTFDNATGPSTPVCAMSVIQIDFVSGPYRLHPIQPRLWSGCKMDVAYRL